MLAGLIAASALPASARRIAPPDRKVKTSAIHWTIEGGTELHGFMAIPAKARGRQPAVLLVGSGPNIDGDMLQALAVSTAQAGFVVCAPSFPSDEAALPALRGTVRWLAGNRYGTGRVAVIALGAARGPALTLARERAVAAAVVFGEPAEAGGVAILAVPPARDWSAAWSGIIAFLRGHLT